MFDQLHEILVYTISAALQMDCHVDNRHKSLHREQFFDCWNVVSCKLDIQSMDCVELDRRGEERLVVVVMLVWCVRMLVDVVLLTDEIVLVIDHPLVAVQRDLDEEWLWRVRLFERILVQVWEDLIRLRLLVSSFSTIHSLNHDK